MCCDFDVDDCVTLRNSYALEGDLGIGGIIEDVRFAEEKAQVTFYGDKRPRSAWVLFANLEKISDSALKTRIRELRDAHHSLIAAWIF